MSQHPIVTPPAERNQNRITTIVYLLILSSALLLAVFLRFYKLGEVPPALNGDEAAFGIGALQILREGPQLYIEGQGGGGILASYIVAFFFLLSEPGKMPLRFQASLFGTLTVLLLFFTAREMFLAEGKTRANLIGAFAALLMAIGHNQVTISRIAFAIVHLPFLQLAAIFLFWRAYQKNSRVYLVLAGVALAGVLYGYIAGIITPLLFLTFLLIAWAAGWLKRKLSQRKESQPPLNPPQKGRSWLVLPPLGGVTRSGFFTRGGLFLYFGLPFLLCTAPFVISLIINLSAGSSGRVTETSFLNPIVNQGNPWGALWYGLRGNFIAFGLAPLDWLARGAFSRFLLDPLSVLTFIGVIIAVLRVAKPPYLFLLLWWGLTILPAALAPVPVPYATRAIGVFSPMSILGGITLAEITCLGIGNYRKLQLGGRSPMLWLKLAAAMIIIAWTVVAAGRNVWRQYDYYFNDWPYLKETLDSYDFYAPQLVQDMAAVAGPQSALILPRNTSAGSISPNGSVNFYYMLADTDAPHYWLPDNETTLPTMLAEAAQNASAIHVIDWKITKHSGADPKEVIDYYLEKYGALNTIRQYEFYDIKTYTLEKPGLNFSAAEALNETAVNFGGQLALLAYAFGNAGPGDSQAAQIAAGEPVWVRLRWQKLADHPEDLKVSLILKDERGRRIAAIDKYLQNNLLHQRSSRWAPDSVAETYFLLPLPAALMPGQYALSIAAYGDETQAPLPTLNGQDIEYNLGLIDVASALAVAEYNPGNPAYRAVGSLQDGLELLVETQTFPEAFVPGQNVDFNVVWHTANKPVADYNFSITLSGDDIRQELWPEHPIGGQEYPTGLWRPGETLNQRLSIKIPPGTGGSQELEMTIWQDGQKIAAWPLAQFEVHDWEHSFTLPKMTPLPNTKFGDVIELTGYSIDITEPTADNDGQAILKLYWRGQDIVTEDLISFVHLVDGGGQIIAQLDHVPAAGARPAPGWLPGEVVTDSFTLTLPAAVDAASLSFVIGMYTPENFARLPVQVNGRVDDKLLIPLALRNNVE